MKLLTEPKQWETENFHYSYIIFIKLPYRFVFQKGIIMDWQTFEYKRNKELNVSMGKINATNISNNQCCAKKKWLHSYFFTMVTQWPVQKFWVQNWHAFHLLSLWLLQQTRTKRHLTRPQKRKESRAKNLSLRIRFQ